jgi:hypothetical protein
VRVWNTATGELLSALRVAHRLRLAVALTGSMIVVAGDRGPYLLRLGRPMRR